MKTVNKGDILQVIKLAPGESSAPRVLAHETQMPDSRARWVFSILQSWGATAILGDCVAQAHDMPPKPPMAPTDLVVRVCEVVDAAWNEMRHRGWIVDACELDDQV